MSKISLLDKLKEAPKEIHEKLDAAKSKRMSGAKSNYIPSVKDVAAAISSIPSG